MMKIAILSFYSGHLERGVENWTHQIASRLAKKHEVTVFQNGPKGSGLNYEVVSINLKVNWKKKDSRGTLARMVFIDYWSRLIALFTLKLLPKLFKKHFDIIIPTSGGWQPAFVRLFTWVRGGKMIVVGHSGKGWDERNNIYSFPDVFIGLSKFAKKWAGKINPLIKTVYIPNGIDLNLFTQNGIKAKIPLERPIILSVGAPEKGKRIELVIKAVSKLDRGTLLVLGGGYQELKIRTYGQEYLGRRFMMKKVEFSQMPSYYRAVDVFTSPSAPSYSFEMVILEAMATNLPVVANNDPIRKEIVGEAGILVDPKDTNAYAKALEKALKTDWGNKPRKQAEKFSWDKVVTKYEELFESLLK